MTSRASRSRWKTETPCSPPPGCSYPPVHSVHYFVPASTYSVVAGGWLPDLGSRAADKLPRSLLLGSEDKGPPGFPNPPNLPFSKLLFILARHPSSPLNFVTLHQYSIPYRYEVQLAGRNQNIKFRLSIGSASPDLRCHHVQISRRIE